jgi:hypothetical protein
MKKKQHIETRYYVIYNTNVELYGTYRDLKVEWESATNTKKMYDIQDESSVRGLLCDWVESGNLVGSGGRLWGPIPLVIKNKQQAFTLSDLVFVRADMVWSRGKYEGFNIVNVYFSDSIPVIDVLKQHWPNLVIDYTIVAKASKISILTTNIS